MRMQSDAVSSNVVVAYRSYTNVRLETEITSAAVVDGQPRGRNGRLKMENRKRKKIGCASRVHFGLASA